MGIKGAYPRILEHETQGEQARQLFADANVLLDRMIEKKLITARAVYGFFPASAVGDDVGLYTDTKRDTMLERFHFLRQQANREGSEPCRSLADFIAPQQTGLPDHIGAFAVTSGIGLKDLCDRFRADNDDYNAIMAEAIADRLAEAFAECLHKRVRDEWGYGRDECLNYSDLIQEKYRGSAGGGLPSLSRPHREGNTLALAQCAGQHWDADYGVVRDVARIKRQRALFRPSTIAIFQPREDRSRSGR